MISSYATASAKVILFGEHAVVYGQPAVAIPLLDVKASAEVALDPSISTPLVEAKDLRIKTTLNKQSYPDAIRHIIKAIELVNEKVVKLPASGWRLTIWSKIPMATGLGSSAAISIAVLRALIKSMNKIVLSRDLIKYSFELEKIHHGTPSGIDNTVISVEKPILFRKDKEPVAINAKRMFFIIGDTGIGKSTADVVSQVAEARDKNIEYYDSIFDKIGFISRVGARALQDGDVSKLGRLMDENQSLLEKINVSSPELERLIKEAKLKGALGAKLCGAGQGGCMVAITKDGTTANIIAKSLVKAGAKRSFTTKL
ncbi:MAG: mevalonate kinase [bacterium]|nr:MAG: mevalonate kinase [bacterium]